MGTIRTISKERMKKYEKKFELFDKLDENGRLLAMKKDPTMFAYGFFRNPDGTRMKLYGFQDLILNDRSKMIAIAISRQVGKEQPYSAKVLTPNGFKRMGELRVGEEVIGGNGKPTKILDIFEQGEKDVYEIEFTDGSKTECGLEHLWKVRGSGVKNWKVLPLKQIIKERGMNPTSDSAYRIPVVEPVEFKENKHIIHPYVMGALLGDGCLTQNWITFTCDDKDKEIVDKINSFLPEEDILEKKSSKHSYYLKRKKRNNEKSETAKEIERLWLNGLDSESKFIPEEYMIDSPKNRLLLLKGLMDTDGSIWNKCRMEFSTVSISLARQVKELVQSLGGKSYYTQRMGQYKKEDGTIIKTKINYRVVIKLQDMNPFSLKRKAEKFYNIKYNKDRIFKSIKLIRKEESRCLLVDNEDHTYITDDYIVTHNSVGAVILALWYIYWNDNYTILLISKTLAQSKELISKLKAIINSSPMRDDFKETATGPDNRSEFYLKNHGKDSQSRIISVPATDAARGYSANLVIADEIAFWENSIEVFNEAILPTVSHTDGTIMMLSTPKGNIGVFYDAFTKDDIWSCYQFTWEVCPVHTPEKMELKRQQIGDFAFRQEYEASFVANQAAYFSHDEVKRAINPNLTLGKHVSAPVIIGVDFGKKNDNTVITIGCIPNSDDHPDYHYIEVVDIIEKPLNTDYNQVVGELKDLFKRYNVQNIIYDATGVGEGPGDFMKDMGLRVEPFKFSLQSKVNIYSNLKILIEKSQLKIPNNKKLIDELLMFEYEYTTSGNMKLHHPEGGHDDYADSLALMCYGLKRPGHKPVGVTLVPKKKVLYNSETKEEVNPKFQEIWNIMEGYGDEDVLE